MRARRRVYPPLTLQCLPLCTAPRVSGQPGLPCASPAIAEDPQTRHYLCEKHVKAHHDYYAADPTPAPILNFITARRSHDQP